MIDRFWILYDRAPLRVIGAILALIAFLVIGVLCGVARAADATVSWTHPTLNTDGSPIPSTGAGSISNTRIEYGSCAGAAFGTKAGEVNVAAPASSTTIIGLAAATTYCFRGYSRNSYGIESMASAVVNKLFPAPTPNPPMLAVPVIAGMLQTPVYSVASTGKMSTFVGFADVGTQCSGPVLFTYRAKSFREVPRASVKLWGSTSLRLAAPCA